MGRHAVMPRFEHHRVPLELAVDPKGELVTWAVNFRDPPEDFLPG
jgi:hypothetical protein